MSSSPATEMIQTTTTSNTAAKNICTHVIKVRAEQLPEFWSIIRYTSRTRHDIATLVRLTSIAAKAANRQSTSREKRMKS